MKPKAIKFLETRLSETDFDLVCNFTKYVDILEFVADKLSEEDFVEYCKYILNNFSSISIKTYFYMDNIIKEKENRYNM